MKEVVLSSEQIQDVCKKLGKQLSEDLANEEKLPLFVGVLKGGMNFFFSLVPHIERKILIDFVQTSSYGGGTRSTGVVTLTKDLTLSPNGRTVVLVDDVVDTGLSMSYLIRYFELHYKPKRILVCSLFDKKPLRKEPVNVDYAGVVLEDNRFLVGFGLDYREMDRNLDYVYIPDDKDIAEMDRLAEQDKLAD